jgi:hypothetical protein
MFGQQIQHRKAWENIMKDYEDMSLTNGLSLLRGLSVINYYRNMAEYVTKIMSTAHFSSGSLVDDKFVCVIMLSGLPQEYNLTILETEKSGQTKPGRS